MAERRRLFAGVELDEGARAVCASAAERLRAAGFAAAYEPPEKLHLTLAFLGNVEAERVDAVAGALDAAARAAAPFVLTIDKISAFPHERKPRIVFAGCRDQGAAFRTLAASVRERYEALGFSFAADAVAHVTIARVKDPRRPLPQIDVAPALFPVARLSLFESLFDPARGTTRYAIVCRCELRPQAPAPVDVPELRRTGAPEQRS